MENRKQFKPKDFTVQEMINYKGFQVRHWAWMDGHGNLINQYKFGAYPTRSTLEEIGEDISAFFKTQQGKRFK